MESQLLPIEQGRHFRLPRHRRVCRLCYSEASNLGNERRMPFQCPALADFMECIGTFRDEFFPLVAD